MENTNKEWNIGDIVFYEAHNTWGLKQINKAEITGFAETENENTPYAKTNGLNFDGNDGALLSELYETEDACRKAIIAKHEAKKQSFRDMIPTVNDLVIFMFRHCINGDEYTDWTAYEVVKEKAEEFGISLD